MPIFPKITVEKSPTCNLRQALQWLKDGIEPVHTDLEQVLGIPNWIDSYELQKETSSLFAALLSKRIRLFGCPRSGKMYFGSGNDRIYDGDYGDRQEISVEEIRAATLDGMDFENSRLFATTDYDEHDVPSAGWEYGFLVLRTDELMQTFPPTLSGQKTLPPIDLKVTLGTGSDWLPSSRPEPNAETAEVAPLARMEPLISNENQLGPENVVPGGRNATNSHETLASAPYSHFLVQLFEQLGSNAIARLKKEDLETTIREHWSSALGPPSDSLIGYMATILRPPGRSGGAQSNQRSRWRRAELASDGTAGPIPKS